jgi:hypothetical protein
MTDPHPTAAAIQLYRDVLLDEQLRAMRTNYCRMASASLASIASWLGFDSALGGGDVPMAGSPATPNTSGATDADRHIGFRATAAVVEMAAQLATGSLALLDADLRYAASALIRQLIETEYLLTAFDLDFSRASEWARATPDEIRRSFAPKTMRSLGGFSNQEYWQHCTMGGHPSPTGRRLLQYGLHAPPSEDDFLTASTWGDLAQHLRRLWSTTNHLLSSQHARYAQVRSSQIEQVREIEERWVAADPLAFTVNFALLNDLTSDAP